jgi:Cdc6-like AAA superfamily ATPase
MKEKTARIFEANKAFTPSAPIDDFDLFAGRQKEVQQVLGGVGQKGQHIVIYGDRGVGKTSLANVLKFFLSHFMGKQSCVVKVNCDGSSTTASIWRSALREIPAFQEKAIVGFGRAANPKSQKIEERIKDDVSPEDIRYILQQIGGSPVIIFDELDRIKSKKTITSLSDTIKTLSDHSVSATLILVGVSDSVDNLILEHKSIERALIQVRMPRMLETESMEIVEKGLAKLKMGITQDALKKIARLSQGLPHYTHLLGLYAATCAITNDSNEITNMHVLSAIREAVAVVFTGKMYLESISIDGDQSAFSIVNINTRGR